MKRFSVLVLATLPLLALQQAGSAPCLAQLTLSKQGEILQVTSSCRSRLSGPAHYSYELRTQRRSPAWQSHTTQRGSFDLPAQQQLQLSQVGFNAGADNHYRIHLLVFDNTGRAVAQDSVVH